MNFFENLLGATDLDGPQDETTTRLLVRQRLSYSPDIKWVWRLTEPVGFVMERKMMLGIRQRAERHS